MANVQKEYDSVYLAYKSELDSVEKKITFLISSSGIKLYAIKSRVKTLESFSKKVALKKYVKPFIQCTDLIGIRLVCFFREQIVEIIALIRSNFKIIEEFEKGKDNAKEFAYSSYHVIIQLESGLCCEIQIRTVLEDAWAEIEHNMNYKAIGADKELLRKINSLSALFEIAEDQFTQIQKQNAVLIKSPSDSVKEINGVLLYNFCKDNFSWAWKNPAHFKDLDVISEYDLLALKFKEKRIVTIKDLKVVFEKKKEELFKDDIFRSKEVLANPKQWPSLFEKVKSTGHFYSPIVLLGMLSKLV